MGLKEALCDSINFLNLPLVCNRAFQILGTIALLDRMPVSSSTLLHYYLTFSDEANVGCHICECWCDTKKCVCLFITTEIIWKVLEGCPFDINQWAKFTYFPSICRRIRIIDIQQLWILQLWWQVVLHTTRGLGPCHVWARLDVSGPRFCITFGKTLALLQNPLGIWQSYFFWLEHFFSRMRSEGFSFIVGVWGWTCVRVVLGVVSSSEGRRGVVVASLIHCHAGELPEVFWEISSDVWNLKEVSHEMLVLALQSHKMGGHFRVLRDRRNTLEACQCKRVVFSWQAQHFAMWRFALAWQAQHFVACPKCF